jgi:hypothetical protein
MINHLSTHGSGDLKKTPAKGDYHVQKRRCHHFIAIQIALRLVCPIDGSKFAAGHSPEADLRESAGLETRG